MPVGNRRFRFTRPKRNNQWGIANWSNFNVAANTVTGVSLDADLETNLGYNLHDAQIRRVMLSIAFSDASAVAGGVTRMWMGLGWLPDSIGATATPAALPQAPDPATADFDWVAWKNFTIINSAAGQIHAAALPMFELDIKSRRLQRENASSLVLVFNNTGTNTVGVQGAGRILYGLP